MRFAGRMAKAGSWWAIEVPDLGAFSQGKTKKEAYAMIRDAIESMIDKPGFSVDVHLGKGGYFEIRAGSFSPDDRQAHGASESSGAQRRLRPSQKRPRYPISRARLTMTS